MYFSCFSKLKLLQQGKNCKQHSNSSSSNITTLQHNKQQNMEKFYFIMFRFYFVFCCSWTGNFFLYFIFIFLLWLKFNLLGLTSAWNVSCRLLTELSSVSWWGRRGIQIGFKNSWFLDLNYNKLFLIVFTWIIIPDVNNAHITPNVIATLFESIFIPSYILLRRKIYFCFF